MTDMETGGHGETQLNPCTAGIAYEPTEQARMRTKPINEAIDNDPKALDFYPDEDDPEDEPKAIEEGGQPVFSVLSTSQREYQRARSIKFEPHEEPPESWDEYVVFNKKGEREDVIDTTGERENVIPHQPLKAIEDARDGEALPLVDEQPVLPGVEEHLTELEKFLKSHALFRYQAG